MLKCTWFLSYSKKDSIYMKVLVQVRTRNLKAPCSTCLGTCGPSARGEDLVMYYNVLLFLLPTTKLRFTGRLDPGKVFLSHIGTLVF
jgi:hypothetical protein